MQRYLWKCWGMFLTLRIRRWESNIFSVDYHSPTKIELILTNPRCWRTPSGKENVVMIILSISMNCPKIGKRRIRLDSIRRDSIPFLAIILGRIHSFFNQTWVGISKNFHLKVETNQQRRKGRKKISQERTLTVLGLWGATYVEVLSPPIVGQSKNL